LKNFTKYILQKILGFERYLFWFSRFKIQTLEFDKNENHFFHFIEKLPNKGVVIDIGANIGIMSVLLSKYKPDVTIISFEPIPENFSALQRIVNHYQAKNVQLNQVAVGDANGQIQMVMPTEQDVRLQGLSHVVVDEKTTGVKYNVPIVTLDSFTEGYDMPIVGIKMDVENYEYHVLKGAKQTLIKHKPILYIELWENDNRTKCMDLLAEIGYKPFLYNGEALEPFQNQYGHNFFFILQ
jgi:FkbM family methyltransferase